jgi:hypothetical protein
MTQTERTKMTKLKLTNYFLQFLFVRLTRCSEKVASNVNVQSFDVMSDGNISMRSNGDVTTYEWFSLQFFIIPFTGWGKPFKYLGKVKFKQLTKKKIVL